MRNSIFATFPVISSACPVWRNFELFLPIKQIPSPHEVPAHFPFNFPGIIPVGGLLSPWTYPFNFSTDIQSFLPFQGMTSRKTFSSKKSFVFTINRCLSGTKSLLVQCISGASLGGLLGMDWGLFSSKHSPCQGRIQGMG